MELITITNIIIQNTITTCTCMHVVINTSVVLNKEHVYMLNNQIPELSKGCM